MQVGASIQTGPFFRVLPDWSGTGIVAEVGTLNSVDKSLYLPPKPETLSYDADGNLTGDGRFTYTYDGENRLIRVEKAVDIPVAPGLGIDGVWYYEYDYLGRRIRKLRRTIVIEEMMTMNNMSGEGGNEGGGETNSLGGGGEMGEMGPIVEELRFMYDGWVLMEELSGTNAVVRSYVHGPDLSSSLGGAGGIGGTAFQVDAATASSTNTRWFTFDPQVNVTDLRSVSDNSRWATMEYGPFGEPLIGAGTNGVQFKLRFSGKYFDEETGFNYFGKRYYDPFRGRWTNRDPVEEADTSNLYTFVANAPFDSVDAYGDKRVVLAIRGAGASWFNSVNPLPLWRQILESNGISDMIWEEVDHDASGRGFENVLDTIKDNRAAEGCAPSYNTLIVLGYSWGGDSAWSEIPNKLGYHKIKANLVFTIDPVPTFDKQYKVNERIERGVNIYQTTNSTTWVKGIKPEKFRGLPVAGTALERRFDKAEDFDPKNFSMSVAIGNGNARIFGGPRRTASENAAEGHITIGFLDYVLERLIDEVKKAGSSRSNYRSDAQ